MLNHIIKSFESAFKHQNNTILVGGAEEPFYQPRQSGDDFSIVYFKEDFVASALHEIAHWCLAGPERRKFVDYGYWYEADRDENAQCSFEMAEVKPQSIEWILSTAAGVPFSVSADNLNLEKYCTNAFRRKIHIQTKHYLLSGLPKRVSQIATLLSQKQLSKKELPQTFGQYLSLQQYKDPPR